MSFLEIKQGLIIKTDQIESIELMDTGGSKITMESGNIHEVNFRHNQLMQIIRMEERNEDKHRQFLAG